LFAHPLPVTDLRGFWKGRPTSRALINKRLQEEQRAADKASEEELRQRFAGDDEADV